MAKKVVYFEDKALDVLGSGVNAVAAAVGVTLGPGGRNVLLEKPHGAPQITKDGVSVAREAAFGDLRKLGAEAVKQASIKTAEVAGDGTTSSMVLTQEIFAALRRAIAGGMHPVFLKRGMDLGARMATRFIAEYGVPVKDVGEVTKVATLASNGDAALGELIAKAIEMVGKDGVISVEDSQTMETYLEFSEGLQLDRGYLSHDFITDPESAGITLEDAYVLIADQRLTSAHDLLPALELAHQENRPLFIVAHDLEGEALKVCLFNHLNRVITVAACKAPRIGEKRTEILQNLAALTGGKVVSNDTGVSLTNVDPQVLLGGVSTVTCDKDVTTFVGGHGTDGEIQEQIAGLKARLGAAWSEHDKEFYQQQMSQLSGGIALIKVGAATEVALKEYKARVEDALSATSSAVRSGIVPGGGVTLLEAATYLEDAGQNLEWANEEEAYGYEILKKSLKKPFVQIVENAGYNAQRALIAYEDEGGGGKVFDARQGQIADALEVGVIDPVIVVQQVIQNAVSVATTLATASCIIAEADTEWPEDVK